MNYLWSILLEAENKGIDKNSISFVPAKICSPYMEIALEDINRCEVSEVDEIEVNPWYRFYNIFKDLFHIDNHENVELREVLFDIVLHYLAEIDLVSGVNKQHFYKELILRDINNNIFGKEIKDDIKVLESEELDIILDSLINLYSCNTSLHLVKKVIRQIFKKSIVYLSKEKSKDIYIYLNKEYTKELEQKINLILNIFLPINMEPHIYWDKHFGIIGLDSTMKIDNIVMV